MNERLVAAGNFKSNLKANLKPNIEL